MQYCYQGCYFSTEIKYYHLRYNIGPWDVIINNCPVQCYDEAVIEEMTEDREMLTNPDLVEQRKKLQTQRGENPLIAQKMMKFNPQASNVLNTLAAEEGRSMKEKMTRAA